jgi:hypothetical protein
MISGLISSKRRPNITFDTAPYRNLRGIEGLLTLLASCFNLQRLQFCHAEEVVCSSNKPSGQLRPSLFFKPSPPESPNALDPTSNLLHPLPNPLTDFITQMSSRSPVNGQSASSWTVDGWRRKKGLTSFPKFDISLTKFSFYCYRVAIWVVWRLVRRQ